MTYTRNGTPAGGANHFKQLREFRSSLRSFHLTAV